MGSQQKGASLKHIASQFDISTSAVSINVKRSINKIFEKLRDETDASSFDICQAMIDYFNMSPEELVKQLDQKNLSIVRYDAASQFHMSDGNEDESSAIMRFFS